MKHLLFLSLALLTPAALTVAASVFTTDNRQIRLNGEVFSAKGVCYQPTPIGQDPSAAPPFGDYYTSGYADLWARDFVNIRKMGANLIRLYSWTPGPDHSAFLEAAWNNGEEPLYVLINRYINPATDWTDPAAVDAIAADWIAIANEVKDHPAVMGFLVGNEVNAKNGNGYNPDFWAAMNNITTAVKLTAPDKLVSVAITEALDQVSTHDAFMTFLDFWALQVYRGDSFGSFFDEYAAVSTKPLIVTEFGYDAWNANAGAEFSDNARLPADAMETLLNELKANAAIASGGCVFEYADEWWKSGSPFTHDAPPGWPGPFADGEGNEEWWGVFRIVDNSSDPDILQPRAMFYRIAAMWNPPLTSEPVTMETPDDFRFTFDIPEHLRDQNWNIDYSENLQDWVSIAWGGSDSLLRPTHSALSITTSLAGETWEVDAVYDIDGDESVGMEELIENSGFDAGSATGWATPGFVSTRFAHSPPFSLRLEAGGGFSVVTAFQSLPAAEGEVIRLSGRLLAESGLPGGTFGVLKIVFRNEAGVDLPPASVNLGVPAPDPNFPGAESRPLLDDGSSPATWIFSETEAVAPAGTVSVSCFLINVASDANAMHFDSIEVSRKRSSPGTPVFIRVRNEGR